MTDDLQMLQRLEAQMRELIRIRTDARAAAEQAIKNADREFDRAAIPLARHIRRLRERIEDDTYARRDAEDRANHQRERKRERAPFRVTEPDLGSDEDTAHFQALLKGNR